MKQFQFSIILLFTLCSFQSFGQLINQYVSTTSDSSEIFRVVEKMPYFPGCEEVEDLQERKKCADRKMIEFIYGRIRYPDLARESNIQGFAVIRFVVNKDGSIDEAEIMRDPGAGIGEESLRVVQEMPDWNPGYQKGKPVRVYFNIPIKFRLEEDKVDKKKKRKGNQPKVDNKAIGH